VLKTRGAAGSVVVSERQIECKGRRSEEETGDGSVLACVATTSTLLGWTTAFVTDRACTVGLHTGLVVLGIVVAGIKHRHSQSSFAHAAVKVVEVNCFEAYTAGDLNPQSHRQLEPWWLNYRVLKLGGWDVVWSSRVHEPTSCTSPSRTLPCPCA
jgi:hypothetical protein